VPGLLWRPERLPAQLGGAAKAQQTLRLPHRLLPRTALIEYLLKYYTALISSEVYI